MRHEMNAYAKSHAAEKIAAGLVAAAGLVLMARDPAEFLMIAIAGAAALLCAEGIMMLANAAVDCAMGRSRSLGILLWGDQRLAFEAARGVTKIARGPCSARARHRGYHSLRASMRLKSGVERLFRRPCCRRGPSRRPHRARTSSKFSTSGDSSGSNSSDPPPHSTTDPLKYNQPREAAELAPQADE